MSYARRLSNVTLKSSTRVSTCLVLTTTTDAATAGLEEIKAILATNPVLAAPNLGEPMLLYIAATHQVVSAVLVVERETEGHNDEAQELSGWYAENAFFRIELNVICSEVVECHPQVVY